MTNTIKAVITAKFVDHFGQICTCNFVESLDKTFERFKYRIDDIEKKGYRHTGDTTIQFVEIED